jgi:exonuclease VII large subunit
LESEVKNLTKEMETAINNEKISSIEAKQLDEKISSRLIEEKNTKNNLEKFIEDRNTKNSNNLKNKSDILNTEDEIVKHASHIDSLKAGYQIIENELQVNLYFRFKN